MICKYFCCFLNIQNDNKHIGSNPIVNLCNIFKIQMLLLQSIRKRLTSLIDNHLQAIQRQLNLHPKIKIKFNESLLEDWNDLMVRMISLDSLEAKKIPAREEAVKNMLPVCSRLPKPASYQQSHSYSRFLLSIQSNICDIYDLKEPSQPILSKLVFQRGYLRRYSSYTFIDPEHVVVIGGSEQKNPNQKCKEILLMNILSIKISKIGELPYGVSSHSAVYVGNQIFVIGGNKDMNMVTKSCLSFHVPSRQAILIQNLNYASASHTCMNWKDKFIYKVGGVGNCFGSWDLSPYIERYSLIQQSWSIINPIVKIDDSILQHYSLLANPLVYQSSKNSLIILGGYDFNFQPSNKMLEIQIGQSEKNGDEQFQIINISTVEHLQKGGFFQQQPLIINEQLFAIETILLQKGKQVQRIVGVSSLVKYYKVQI